MDRTAKRNAFLYCKLRDMQFALYDRYAKQNGILMNTLLVLNALYYAQEPLSQKDICEITFNSKQTVNTIVKKFIEDGHAVVRTNPADKRNRLIQLTNAGRSYAKTPVEHITRSEDEAMAMFSKEEQETLIDLSRTFTKNLTKLINESE